MITTTTPSIEGKRIQEYKGIVFGEVVAGVDVIKDFTPGSAISLEDAPVPMRAS